MTWQTFMLTEEEVLRSAIARRPCTTHLARGIKPLPLSLPDGENDN
ncbi:MAG: hypothetical protein M3115_05480 [Thermoproteota archaeon]|nr:hypothetical protein [Thermoproteota archaeon]